MGREDQKIRMGGTADIERPTSPVLRPGDRVVHAKRRPKPRGLRRVLGVAGLYSIGYGNVGASIYYALGITAVYALGATPIALLGAGVFFVLTAATYAEGAAMFPEAGGSSSFARHAFNEFWSFVAGWALMLAYMVTLAISAVTVPSYLGYFFPLFKESPPAGTALGMGLILFLMALNVIGTRHTSRFHILWAVLGLLTQSLLILLGLLFLLDLPRLIGYVGGGPSTWPTLPVFASALSISMIAYTGLESVCQMAEEARDPKTMIPRSLMLTVLTVIGMYALIPFIALSAYSPAEFVRNWSTDPVAGIASALPTIPVADIPLPLAPILAPWIAVLASSILLIAANASLLGISRLAFSMAEHQQLPSLLVRMHPRFRTPSLAIIAFSGLTLLLLVPGFSAPGILLKFGGLYSFGAMLSFTFAHASIIALRLRAPDLPRPFVPWGDIRLRKARIPLSPILGLVGTFTIWLIVLTTHPWGRTVGSLWLLGGIGMYIGYRKRHGLPLCAPAPPGPVSST